jgi:hypothetical protein
MGRGRVQNDVLTEALDGTSTEAALVAGEPRNLLVLLVVVPQLSVGVAMEGALRAPKGSAPSMGGEGGGIEARGALKQRIHVPMDLVVLLYFGLPIGFEAADVAAVLGGPLQKVVSGVGE